MLPVEHPPNDPLPRQALQRALFEALDKDKDGHLSSDEMLEFARLTGFKGVQHEWQEEFSILCDQYQSQVQVGLTLETFLDMVEEDSDKGCYVTDSQLATVRKELQRRDALPEAETCPRSSGPDYSENSKEPQDVDAPVSFTFPQTASIPLSPGPSHLEKYELVD